MNVNEYMWQMSLQWMIRCMTNDNIWWMRWDDKWEFYKINIIFKSCCEATIQLFCEIKTHAFNSEITVKL